VARGICTINESGYLTRIVERTKIQVFYDGTKYYDEKTSDWTEVDPMSIVSMNMWGFTPEFFDKLKEQFVLFLSDEDRNLETAEFYLPFAVDELLSSGTAKVRVLKSKDLWYGVTYAEDKPRVKEAILKMVREGKYPEKL
jgi:hypothetical protein